MAITILRLGHRIFRDQRISTHVFLVARALGADTGVYSGEEDHGLEESVARISEQFGGSFAVRYEKNAVRFIEDWKRKGGAVVHLTVYGLPAEKTVSKIKIRSKRKPLLVIAGGEKVPRNIYDLTDWNVEVTNQPHSEVGALSLFLYLLRGPAALKTKFPKAGKTVVPQERGKKVIEKGSD